MSIFLELDVLKSRSDKFSNALNILYKFVFKWNTNKQVLKNRILGVPKQSGQ